MTLTSALHTIDSHLPTNRNAVVHDSFRPPSRLRLRNHSAPRPFARAYVRLPPSRYQQSRVELLTSRCVRTSEADFGVTTQHLNSRRFTRDESSSADYGGSVARERHACAGRLRSHIRYPGWIERRFIHRRNRQRNVLQLAAR